MGLIAAAYGVVCYVVFLCSFLYPDGFSWAISSCHGPSTPVRAHHLPWRLSSICSFSVRSQCSTAFMARPGFKTVWTRIVPRSIERSTYVLLSSLLSRSSAGSGDRFQAPSGMCQPLPWAPRCCRPLLGRLAHPLARDLHGDPFDLFGLRQVYLRMRGLDFSPPRFTRRALYKLVRHPIISASSSPSGRRPRISLGLCIFALTTTATSWWNRPRGARPGAPPRRAISGLPCPGPHAVAARQPQEAADGGRRTLMAHSVRLVPVGAVRHRLAAARAVRRHRSFSL